MEVVKLVITHGAEILSAVVALLSAVIAVAMLIPGDEPEKTLQKIVDVLKKLSAKPAVKAEEAPEVKSE